MVAAAAAATLVSCSFSSSSSLPLASYSSLRLGVAQATAMLSDACVVQSVVVPCTFRCLCSIGCMEISCPHLLLCSTTAPHAMWPQPGPVHTGLLWWWTTAIVLPRSSKPHLAFVFDARRL